MSFLSPFLCWLRKPFHFPPSAGGRLVISFTFGLFVFLFLRIFLPYGLSDIPVNKTLFISVYGILTFVIIALWLFLTPLFYPGLFGSERFTIGKYIFLCFGNTMLVNIANWIYTITAGADILPAYKFLPFTLFTLSVGIFPVVFLSFVIDDIMQRKKTRNSIQMQGQDETGQKNSDSEDVILIKNRLGGTEFLLPKKDFICARSSENYTHVYYFDNDLVRNELIRIPLTRFFEQLKNGNDVVRCHRSAVVNLLYLKRVRGNARKLELEMEHFEELVPVSRDFPRRLLYRSGSMKEN